MNKGGGGGKRKHFHRKYMPFNDYSTCYKLKRQVVKTDNLA